MLINGCIIQINIKKGNNMSEPTQQATEATQTTESTEAVNTPETQMKEAIKQLKLSEQDLKNILLDGSR